MFDVQFHGLSTQVLPEILFSQDGSPLSLDAANVFEVIFAVFAEANVIQLFDRPSVEWVLLLWIRFLAEVVVHRPDIGLVFHALVHFVEHCRFLIVFT